jgi:Tripartite tricarboxylate transporter family receptor
MTRSKKYPDVPTLDEARVKGYEVNTWIGFFAPIGTPKEAAAAIEAAIKEAVAQPEVRARFETTGAVVRSGSAEECRRCLTSTSPNGPSSSGKKTSSSRHDRQSMSVRASVRRSARAPVQFRTHR